MPEKKKGTATRTYKVLVQPEVIEVIDQQASGADQAIKLVASEKGAGHYIAVPERSWTEKIVRVETPAPRLFISSVDEEKAETAPVQQQELTPAGATT